MKASKESSSRLCPPGDLSLLAARLGMSGVVARALYFVWAPGGPRGGASPDVAFPGALASLRCAGAVDWAAPASPAACAPWAVGRGEAGGMPGVRHQFHRSGTRLASVPCLVTSACRHVRRAIGRRAGVLVTWLAPSSARYLRSGWSLGG